MAQQQQQPVRKRITPQLIQPLDAPGAGATAFGGSASAAAAAVHAPGAWRAGPAVAPRDPENAASKLGPGRRIYIELEAVGHVVDYRAVSCRGSPLRETSAERQRHAPSAPHAQGARGPERRRRRRALAGAAVDLLHSRSPRPRHALLKHNARNQTDPQAPRLEPQVPAAGRRHRRGAHRAGARAAARPCVRPARPLPPPRVRSLACPHRRP